MVHSFSIKTPMNAEVPIGRTVSSRYTTVTSGDYNVGVFEADARADFESTTEPTIIYFPGFGGRIDGDHGIEVSRTQLIAEALGARVLYLSSPFTEDPDIMGCATRKMPLSLARDIARGKLKTVGETNVNAIKEVTAASSPATLELWSYSQGNSLALGTHNAIAEHMPGVEVPQMLAIEPQAMYHQALPFVLRRSMQEGRFDTEYLQENVKYGYLPLPLGNKTKEQHDTKFGKLFQQQIVALGAVGMLLSSNYFARNLNTDLWERSSQTGLYSGRVDLLTVAGSPMTDLKKTDEFVRANNNRTGLRHFELHAPVSDGNGHHGIVHSMARMASLLDQLGASWPAAK